MWSIQLTFCFLISCRIFLCSLTLSDTSFLTWSVQLIFSIDLQHHISKLFRCFWSAARSVQVSAPFFLNKYIYLYIYIYIHLSSWFKRYCVAAFIVLRHWRLLRFFLLIYSLVLVVFACMFCYTISLHWYNKTCRWKQLTRNYISINKNGNNRQCLNTIKAATQYRLNQELKFLYTKKNQTLNERLCKIHLECASMWHNNCN